MIQMNMKKRISSKKGFTLVELVVVIAILSILAAIAIPTVISIINNAIDSASETDAQTLDTACKAYMAGIYSGDITSSDPGKSTQTTLPDGQSKFGDKKKAVKLATVINACEYAGLTDLIDAIKLTRADTDKAFVYDAAGNIYYADDRPELTNHVTETTTLGDLYGL